MSEDTTPLNKDGKPLGRRSKLTRKLIEAFRRGYPRRPPH